MIDMQRIFHTGIIVHDLETAKREIGQSMGLTWTPVRRFDPLVFWTPQRGLEEIAVEAVYSRQRPHHLELLKGPTGGFYDPDIAPDARHIGVWVDDLALETTRLISLGWTVQAAGGKPEDGYGVIAYLSPPTSAFVVELVSTTLKPVIDEWLGQT